jgi:hypothetical protein
MLCLIFGGYWNNTLYAGVWALYLIYYRTNSNYNVGFRCADYDETPQILTMNYILRKVES